MSEFAKYNNLPIFEIQMEKRKDDIKDSGVEVEFSNQHFSKYNNKTNKQNLGMNNKII